MAHTSLVFHTRLNARFKERMLNITRKTFHRHIKTTIFLETVSATVIMQENQSTVDEKNKQKMVRDRWS